LKPENEDALTKVLAFHVVAGRLTASDLKNQIGWWRPSEPKNGWWRQAGRNDARQAHCVEG